jgi:hypothetical protein
MAACNSRPKENPPYIIPGINRGDQNIKRNCRKLADLSTDELALLLQKIASVYNSRSSIDVCNCNLEVDLTCIYGFSDFIMLAKTECGQQILKKPTALSLILF